ncbi:MAG: MipA/OmpV family protein [Proteobacteria bacterium]|nr:MAG: MipA/OmpV family protein [Pseudomonadota bacterium]
MHRFLLLVCLLPALTQAEHLPRWELGAGIAGLHLPDYRGSNESRDYLAPFPYLVYRGERVRVSEEGIRGLLFESDKVALDLSLSASIPVDSEDNSARQGMPDLDPAFEIGPNLKVRFAENSELRSHWELNLPLRAVAATDFSHGTMIGWIFNPHLDYVRHFPMAGGRLRLVVSWGPLWASEKYHDYYYEVDAAYATPQRPAFDARGGYSGNRLLITVGKRLNSSMVLGGFLRYDDLHGAAFEDSPLVKRNESLMGGIALTWIFARSAETVAHEK